MKSSQLIANRPEPNEYAPYYGKYVSLVPDGDILVTLEKQLPATLALLEQDDYVKDGPFGRCSLAGLVEELASVRKATVLMFRALDEAAWARRGVASNNEVTVLALAYMIAGHELHHRRIFQQKYFPGSVS